MATLPIRIIAAALLVLMLVAMTAKVSLLGNYSQLVTLCLPTLILSCVHDLLRLSLPLTTSSRDPATVTLWIHPPMTSTMRLGEGTQFGRIEPQMLLRLLGV